MIKKRLLITPTEREIQRALKRQPGLKRIPKTDAFIGYKTARLGETGSARLGRVVLTLFIPRGAARVHGTSRTHKFRVTHAWVVAATRCKDHSWMGSKYRGAVPIKGLGGHEVFPTICHWHDPDFSYRVGTWAVASRLQEGEDECGAGINGLLSKAAAIDFGTVNGG